MRNRYLTALLMLALAPAAHAAPPSVTYFYPAGGQAGKSVTVTAKGSFSTWPVKVWANRPGLKIEATKTKGKFQVTIDKNARGIYLLRTHTPEGASAVKPFVVDGINETNEKEPNGKIAEAQDLSAGAIANGKLAAAGDVDMYCIQAKAGQHIVASLMAARVLGSPMDGIVQITDARGFVLEQNDDGGGFDPIAAHRVVRDGKYFVRVFAFPQATNSSIRFAGADNYVYRLTVTTGPFVDYALPLTHHKSQQTAHVVGWNLSAGSQAPLKKPLAGFAFETTAAGWRFLSAEPMPGVIAPVDCSHTKPLHLKLPAVASGCIESAGDSDAFSFDAKKGKKIRLTVAARGLGFPLDPALQIRDAKDKMLTESDDTSRNVRDTEIVFTPPADGKYSAEIRDVNQQGGPRFAYRLHVEPVLPTFKLSVAVDHFEWTQDKPLEIPVTVTRNDGFAADVELVAVDLPAGIAAAPVVSKGKKTATVKLILKGNKPAGGAIRIVGRVKGQPETAAAFAVPQTQLTLDRIWVTCQKKK